MRYGKATDGFVSRYINRKISFPISKAIVKVFGSVSPNKITVLTTILGVIAGLMFLFVDPWIAGTLVQLASILDGVDGEIARMTNQKSRFGGFLDSLLDRFVDISAIIGLSVVTVNMFAESFDPTLLLILCMLALSGNVLVSFFNARSEASLGVHPSNLGGIPLATRDVRLFIIFLGSLATLIYPCSLLITIIVLAILPYIHIFVNLAIISHNYEEPTQAY